MGGSCSLAQGWVGRGAEMTQCPGPSLQPPSPLAAALAHGSPYGSGRGKLLVRKLERCPANWGGLLATHSEEGSEAAWKAEGIYRVGRHQQSGWWRGILVMLTVPTRVQLPCSFSVCFKTLLPRVGAGHCLLHSGLSDTVPPSPLGPRGCLSVLFPGNEEGLLQGRMRVLV